MSRTLLALLSLGLLATAAPAQNTPTAELLDVESHLQWRIDASESSEVTVSIAGPNGEVTSKTFAATETVSLNLESELGESLPDGQYVWEIRFLRAPTGERLEARRRDAGGSPGAASVRLDTAHGSFRIDQGRVAQRADESPAVDAPSSSGLHTITSADQVIADDQIVQQSLCVGQDCVNGESFGFDTIRVKENNLRIHFQDTSNSASFPSNDWRLVANDSNNGGANRFSIEDATAGRSPFTVQAGARANSLFINSAGRLGLGTATPSVGVHLVDGNTPAFRMDQLGGGWPRQIWDVAGNEVNFFVRDITNSSRLPFRIRPGAPTNSLAIDSSGKVGMGTISPSANLHVTGASGTTQFLVEETGADSAVEVLFNLACDCAPGFRLQNTTNGEVWFFRHNSTGDFALDNVGGAGLEVRISKTGDMFLTGALNQSSSRSLKEELEPVDGVSVLQALERLDLYEWQYIGTESRHLGPTAEEFSAAYGLGNSDKAIAPADMAGVALAAIKSLHEKNQELESTIELLTARLEALESQN